MKIIIILLLSFFIFTSQPLSAQQIPSWKIEEVVKYFSKNNDTVYVINFWATFCKPCVAEIPYLQSISSKYKGQKVKLLLVSLDMKESYPEKITAFAKARHFDADIVWLNESNADHFCPMVDKSWSGSIPSTVFINSKKGYKKFFEEEMKEAQFEEELLKAIQ